MNSNEDTATYLQESRFINCNHPDIRAQAATIAEPQGDATDNAIGLYYWVRDEIRYNPYILDPDPASFLASTTLAAGWRGTRRAARVHATRARPSSPRR